MTFSKEIKAAGGSDAVVNASAAMERAKVEYDAHIATAPRGASLLARTTLPAEWYATRDRLEAALWAAAEALQHAASVAS